MLEIELGGGNDPKYHPNIDALALPNVDIVHDLCKGIPVVFTRDLREERKCHKV